MKLKIKQQILMENLNNVIKGISNKNLIPILNCIKFELTKEGLMLISTDNDISIKSFIDKKDIEDIDTLGEIVVSGRYIYDIIKKLPNEIINIEEIMNSKLYIYTNNSSFNLNCNNVSDFPNIEVKENKNPIELEQQVFKNIINQTIFATSTQESRPVLTGINFKIVENHMECTATDSYRLAKKIIELKENVSEQINIIIPTKNLNELTRLFNKLEDKIMISIFSNEVVFQFDNIVFISRIINGQFPDTTKLIPTSFETTIKIKTNELYNAIDRASLLTNEADKNTIKMEGKEGQIKISSNIPEIGNVEETIITENNSFDIKIAFSSKYMMDALKSLECEYVELYLNGEIRPIIIKNPENDDLIQLIVPIRTY